LPCNCDCAAAAAGSVLSAIARNKVAHAGNASPLKKIHAVTIRSVLLFAALAGFGAGAHATEYPDRPIQLIVPYAAGGATDTDFTVQGKPAERALKCAWTRKCVLTESSFPQ